MSSDTINNLQVKGIVRLVKTNIVTKQVTYDETYTNLITDLGFSRIFSHSKIGDNIGISSSTTTPDALVPLVTNIYGYGIVRSGVTNPIYVLSDGVNPSYGEWQMRFNPPTSSRDIWTIFLGIDTSGNASAYLKLSSACTQTTTEVLDIFYRVQFSGDYSIGASTFGVDGLGKACTLGDTNGAPGTTTFLWNANATQSFFNVWGGTNKTDGSTSSDINNWTDYWDAPAPGGTLFSLNFGSQTTNPVLLKRKFAWNIDRKHDNKFYTTVGRIFGTANITSNGSFTFPEGQTANSIARIPIVPTSYSGINPIHFHSGSAISPFQDVNNLSVGGGTISTSGSWTGEAYWPSLYRLNIRTSGDTGTSTYDFNVRSILGFVDNSYSERQVANPLYFSNLLEVSHGLGNTNNLETYSSTSTISWDDTGVILLDHVSGNYQVWNSTTTPALTVTAIRQVAATKVDGTGNIFVAAPNEGLFVINPTANTVTKVAFTDSYINTDKAYAVYRGKTAMWALVEGALASVAVNGSAYTPYAGSTSTVFSQVGITDSHWNSVSYLKSNPDVNAPTEQILFVQSTGITYWYNPSTGVSTQGFTVINTYNTNQFQPGPATASVNGVCISEQGGLWVTTGSSSFDQVFYYLTPFTNTSISQAGFGINRPFFGGGNTFLYDSKGNPFYVFANKILPADNTSSQIDFISNTIRNDATISNSWSLIFPYTNVAMCGPYLQTVSPGLPLGGRVKDLVVTDYGYNASATDWQVDYYGDDVTSTAGYLPIPVRSGFQSNTWLFDGTGAALVQANATTYAAKLDLRTLFLTVNSSQIVDGNNKVLVDFNGAAQFQVLWIDNLNAGKISIVDRAGTHHVLCNRPTDSSDHRLAITINENNKISAYFDGSIVAYNLTIAGISNNKSFLNIVFGSSADLNVYTSRFKGTLKNIVMLSTTISATQAALDFSNITTQTYAIYNPSSTITVDYSTFYGLSNISEATPFVYGTTIQSFNKYVTYDKSIQPTEDWEIDFVVPALGGTANSAAGSVAIGIFKNPNLGTTTYTQLRYGLALGQNGGSINSVINGALQGASLGTFISTDTFKIVKLGSTIQYYKNNSVIKTDTYTNPADTSYAYIAWDYFAYLTVQITGFKVNTTLNSAKVLGHYPLNDTINHSGLKVTSGTSSLIDGINIGFVDTVDITLQWVASDYYTIVGSNGFMKDNIRTLTGDYSLYYKPTQFGLTGVVPSSVSVVDSSAISSQTANLYTGAASHLISILGDSTANTGAYNPTHYMIEYDDLNYLTISLAGTPVTNKWIDAHGMLPKTTLATGVTSITMVPSRSIPFNILSGASAGTSIQIQLDNGTWHNPTLSTVSSDGYTVTFTPGIPTGRTTMSYGHIVRPAIVAATEVAIDPVFGIARFNTADSSKSITANYADIFN